MYQTQNLTLSHGLTPHTPLTTQSVQGLLESPRDTNTEMEIAVFAKTEHLQRYVCHSPR